MADDDRHRLLRLFPQNSGNQIAAVIQVGSCDLSIFGEVKPDNGAGPRFMLSQIVDELAGAR